MPSIISAHPLLPGRESDHREWCRELRDRRDEYGASRAGVGLDHVASWAQPDLGLTVVRLAGHDPRASLRRLDRSDTPFDRWYRERELEIHGRPLSEAAVPTEVIADHVHAAVDPLDPYMALALPLLPGRTEEFRHVMRLGVKSGRGAERARRWGVTRLTAHLQHCDGRDLLIYEISGDLANMVRSLAGGDGRGMEDERWLFRHHFGIDLQAGELPIPEPALAWSSASPS